MSSRRITDHETIEKKITRILKARKMTVTTAESCTGGLVAGTLINADGVSEVYKEGFITYSDDAKMKYLGVEEEILKTCGAVSRLTAQQMAIGAAKEAGADCAVATTGIAGPDGGSDEKPVGLVYIACFVKGNVVVKRCFFSGDRQAIRYAAVKEALEILYCQILTTKDIPQE